MAREPNERDALNAKPRSPSRRRIDPVRAAVLAGVIGVVCITVLYTALTRGRGPAPKPQVAETENIPASPETVGKLGLPPDYSNVAPPPLPEPPPVETKPTNAPKGASQAGATNGQYNAAGRRQETEEERAQTAALTSSILGDDDRQSASPSSSGSTGASGAVKAVPDLTSALAGLNLAGKQDATETPASAATAVGEHFEQQKIKFAAEAAAPASTKNNARLQMPDSPYTIRSGWNIPAILTTKVNTDGPADIHAHVTQRIMDSATGRFLLIPQGSDLQGKLNSVVSPGQVCFQLTWQILTLPNNATIDLAGTPGTDSEGTSCIKGEVDNHYSDLATGIGLSSLVTILGAVAQNAGGASSGGQLNLGNTAASGIAQQSSQVANEFVTRELSIPPTITKKVGDRIYAVVTKALVLQPYQGE